MVTGTKALRALRGYSQTFGVTHTARSVATTCAAARVFYRPLNYLDVDTDTFDSS
jgi:hypothetical protein